MSALSSRQLKSASAFSRSILCSARDLHISRPALRTALVAALSEVDPFAHFSFRLRSATGVCVHGSVRIVREPIPEVDCSDTDYTPF